MQNKASQPLIETLPMTLGVPYTDDPSAPLNIEIPLQVALPVGQTLYAAVALGGLPFHGQQQIAERIAAAWNAFTGVATSNIAPPRQCLLQIQEPPTKTEALAHYSQQAILAMGEAAHAAVAAAAPVVLPEPVAAESRFTSFSGDRWKWCTVEHAQAFGQDKGYEVRYLYTEQQVHALLAGVSAPAGQEVDFQQRVLPWMMACFGPEISADRIERNHRFLEESLELVQSLGCTASEAHQLVDYVFGRPVGEPMQEAGGVMVTLAALCLASGLDMHACGETELARIWTKVEAIRAKQAAKPKHSPLPMHAPLAQADARDADKVKPEAGHYVLAWMEGRKVPIRAMWVPQYHLSAGDEAPEGWGEYSDEKDDWYCPEGWFEVNEHEETHWAVGAPVVSWMELPRFSIAAQAAQQGGAA